MTLVELHVDVARVANALEKIVSLLEKLVLPPPPADLKIRQATVDDLRIVTPEDQVRMLQEQMAFGELHRVVPGSEAFDRELVVWEQEQRSLHGEEWKAPDWAAAFVAAQQQGAAARESPEAAAAAAERR